MKVDIWSDIRCPFCYIGKRKFENALEQFPQKENVQVEWHSFQLDPSLKTQTSENVYDYLAKKKGQSREWSVRMHQHVTETAREVGLTYNFNDVVIANSFNAQRLIQLAKRAGAGDAAEERLFKAYFTDGENIDDHDTLARLGSEIGLAPAEVKQMLAGSDFTTEVAQDEAEAREIGVTGVPFFVINHKYAVSGAQPSETFLKGLELAWKEYEQANSQVILTAEGETCTTDGNC